MVYPNQVISNINWAASNGGDILLALAEGDSVYIYNTSPDNELELGMPQQVVDCQVRVRADGIYPPLLMQFFLSGNLVGSESVPTTADWVEHTLTVPVWDTVMLTVGVGGTVGVDYLRAWASVGLPTRRLLAGVGV